MSILTVREENRLTKRAIIVESAVAEFQKCGFDGTSMDQIAARAGVSKRTVYDYFSSKDGLVRAIATELTGRPEDLADLDYDPQAALASQLTRIGDATLRVMNSDRFLALTRISMSRLVRASESTRRISADVAEQFNASAAKWVQAAVHDGRLTIEDPGLAAKQFLGSLHGVAFWPQLFGALPLSQRRQDQLVRSSVAMFLGHYGHGSDQPSSG